ncbi:Aromatic amino acid aminotransferase [Paramyrothecium foliicola]|nr:Aromatic amino acid aminotransferase [Paramyrothecium foliicola]
MGSLGQKQENVDLSHHINRSSKARHPSPLKDIIKYMSMDGMISLAGGLPHPSLFPLEQVKFDSLSPSAPITDQDLSSRPESDILSLCLGRRSSPGDLELSQFLQYGKSSTTKMCQVPTIDAVFVLGSGAGNKKLLDLCKELTEKVHAPPCEYECLLHPGNTNAWSKVVGLLCEHDDFVLVEEFTYPSAQALWIPLGVKAVPVAADAQGIRSNDLRSLLTGWDETARGSRRPRILYLVSVGSNPTGITISAQRRKEIYEICIEFDIVIVEDDPYYFLQFPGYEPTKSEIAFNAKPTAEFLKDLVPSFLSMDKQGRVIRLESFSKTLFPGLRLGYFVANPIFTERLLRATEVETQDPAGLSQAFVLSLLGRWGVDGYLTWLQSLQFQYRTRRDWLLDAMHNNFVILPAAESPIPKVQGLVACLKRSTDGKLLPVFSFVDPEAGMFVWAKFYFHGVNRFAELQSEALEDPEQAFSKELWGTWASELVLLTPGSYYHPWQGPDKTTTKARGADMATAHFRFSFATPTKEQIHSGMERVRNVVGKYWV